MRFWRRKPVGAEHPPKEKKKRLLPFLRRREPTLPTRKREEKKKSELTIASLCNFSYRLLGPEVASYLGSKLGGLRRSLPRAGLLVTVDAYASMVVVFSSIIAAIAFVWGLLIAILTVSPEAFLPALFLLFGVAAIAWAVSFVFLYAVYPAIKASNRRALLEGELPFVTSFMSVLIEAGLTPEKVFEIISMIEALEGFSWEARMIVRDIKLLGRDLVQALQAAAQRSPSPLLTNLFEGMISTITSGGDLAGYLRMETRDTLILRRIILRQFIDTLGIIAEIQMSAVVVFPLLMIIMLGLMAMMGGGIAGLNPVFLMRLMIYVLLPMIAAILLLLTDAVSPKE